LTYVLITPARNEEALIGQTLEAMVQQTVKPLKWVIVNDGSTDATESIVRRYAREHGWITLVQRTDRRERSFAAKAAAFSEGYAAVRDLPFDILGNLDADISFGPDYFAFLLARFEAMPELGVAGTPFVENGFRYDYRFVNIEHVSGACQLFRRRCFEDIGGYQPLRRGGVDLVAVTTARMRGWHTRTFVERTCVHGRRIGTGQDHVLRARLKVGRQDYLLGGHPLWELFRGLYQMTLKPYVVGGALILFGYAWALVNRYERPVSDEFVAFRRREQIQQLARVIRRVCGRPAQPTPSRLARH
jgi:glycosyltransferase involved in cell wall biosynthesis